MPQSPIPAGVIPPVVTAFNAEGNLDVPSQEAACARQLDAGVQALFVAGTTGEGAFLPPEILNPLIDLVIRYVGGQIPVLIGALAPGTAATVAIAQRAERAGADGVVATVPFYGDSSQAEISRHFRAVAKSTSLPLLAYSIPPMTHQQLAVSTVEEIFADDVVVGLKDSGHDWDSLSAAIDLGAKYGKSVYSGYEPLAGQAVAKGAAGIVASIGNIDPAGIVRLWQTAASDPATAAQEQERLTALVSGFSSYQVDGVGPQSALVAGIKAALAELGVIKSRAVIPPLTTLPENLLPTVREQLRRAGF